MQQIRKQIKLGNLQLAKLNDKQQPVPMQMSQLEEKQQRINKHALILQQLKHFSEQQRLAWIHQKKQQANQLYKYEKYDDAISIYLEALLGIQMQEKNQRKLKLINLTLKYPLMLNIATCLYQKKEYSRAVQLCNRIISEKDGQNHIKAYYKKANCMICLGQFKQTKDIIKKMHQIIGQKQNSHDPDKGSITQLDLTNLLSQLKQKCYDQKQMYKRIFIDNDNQNYQLTKDYSVSHRDCEVISKIANKKRINCWRKIYESIRSCFLKFKASKQSIS